MKRILSALLVCVLLVGCVLSMASCAKRLSGKYSADVFGAGTTMTFDGKDVKIAITVPLVGEVASLDATYEIKDGKISFDIADEEEVTNAVAKKVIASLETPVDFEEGDNYIKIGGAKYEKVD